MSRTKPAPSGAHLAAAAAIVCAVAAGPAHAVPMFGPALSANTTGLAASIFLGAPDDIYVGMGADSVTYDFGAWQIVNRPGAVDINVYEVDFGSPEFGAMRILVSQDGVSFTSLKASESPLQNIAGDAAHCCSSYGRSYDLGALEWARYVRIQGAGTGRAGGQNGFDLDAIGAHSVIAAPIPEAGTWAMFAAGLVAVGAWRRRRQFKDG